MVGGEKMSEEERMKKLRELIFTGEYLNKIEPAVKKRGDNFSMRSYRKEDRELFENLLSSFTPEERCYLLSSLFVIQLDKTLQKLGYNKHLED
jgi:hypothetical protein